MRPWLVALVLVAAATAGCSETHPKPEPSAFVQRPDSRLIRVQSVGLAGFGPINPHRASVEQVREAFGEESSERSEGSQCRRRWASLGLEIRFGAGEGEDACGDDARIEWLAVAGKPAVRAGWGTAEGIRPLQRVAVVERIYPEVGEVRPGTVALVTRPSEFPGPPVLKVTIAEGRVQAMRFPLATD
jgi:hypothetical protein